MKSIKFKLVLLFLTLVLFVMISSGIFIRISIQNAESSRIYQELSSLATIIDLLIIQPNAYPHLINNELMYLAEQPFILTGPYTIQVVLLDENGFSIQAGEPFTSSVIISAMAGEIGFNAWERTQDQNGRIYTWISYATPITVELTGQSLILYLRQNANTLQESLENVTIALVLSILLAIFLASILGTFFAKTLTEPISVLTKLSKEMAKGNLKQTIPVFSDDEIGQLTESFNHMGNSLHLTLENMTSDKTRMEIIIHSMTDGIIVFDKIGTPIHINQAAADIIGTQIITYNDIIKLLDINPAVSSDKVVFLYEKYIRTYFKTYTNINETIDGTIIVLQDVTKHTKLDIMRKEFVANVSHEIRTPLTVIKTYAETLLDQPNLDELSIDFLTTINLEVDRMTLLASDLLELSQFDNRQLTMNNSKQDLLQILKNSISQTNVLADKKNQTITLSTSIDSIPYFCDGSRINQVFVNILSNAIKYSKDNTEITIEAKKEKDNFFVSIKDEGIGIPKENLDHIFERFYRVDKARSRSMGSIGLGLSIVKEILDLSNSEIIIKSEYQKGTEVIIKFPIKAIDSK